MGSRRIEREELVEEKRREVVPEGKLSKKKGMKGAPERRGWKG
jgi:hypothetical protein